ncbi:MAG: methionyl-tRNA formyltransferase [Propionibacteriaceae bacterium]|nr:methionyl-tRNA formyltransferase [Propionibacteriaceae bacterium]
MIFAGTPDTALPVVELLNTSHDIVGVLTRPPAPQGRSSRLVPSPVEQWGRDHGLEILTPDNLHHPSVADRLREISPEVCPVVAYGGLLPQEVLDIPPLGWLNLHYSLLPAYRGAAPVQRALLDGCTHTGVSVFRIVCALDAGPVFVQNSVEIFPEETAGELLERLSVVGAEAMMEAVALAEQGIAPAQQLCQGVSLAPKITSADTRLDAGVSSSRLVARVRAMSPDPGAWAMLGDQRIKVIRARLVADDEPLLASLVASPVPSQVGDLLATKKKLYWRTRQGFVELVEVHPQGKKPMSGADWGRGLPKGSRLV